MDPNVNGPEVVADDDIFIHAMVLASNSSLLPALRVIIELGVLEIIAAAGDGAALSATEIAAVIKSRNSHAAAMLDRLLSLLASYSILTCSTAVIPSGTGVQRRYGLAAVSKHFVPNADGASASSLLLVNLDKVFAECWCYLKEAILEGGVPFEKAHGMNAFEYLKYNPQFKNAFVTSMSNHSSLVMKKIIEKYHGFVDITELMDVGGGDGSALHMIVSHHPHIKGITFDLPNIVANITPYPGVRYIGGDMFDSVPLVETIFMKLILHDWSDEQCLKLLRNCHKSLPNSGKMIAVEVLQPKGICNDLATKYALQLDMLMLAYNSGGKERSEREFNDLAIAAGFDKFRIACRAYGVAVMEFCKMS